MSAPSNTCRRTCVGRAVTGPLKWNAWQASAWYEWRSWGVRYFRMAIPLLIVVFLLQPVTYFVSWVLMTLPFMGLLLLVANLSLPLAVVGLAWLFGLGLPSRRDQNNGGSGMEFLMLRPVSTVRLTAYRTAGRCVPLAATFAIAWLVQLAMLAVLGGISTAAVHPYGILLLSSFVLAFGLMAWAALNAAQALLAIAGCAAVAGVVLALMGLHNEMNGVFVGLFLGCCLTVAMTVMTIRNRLMTWRQLGATAVGSLLVATLLLPVSATFAMAIRVPEGPMPPRTMAEQAPDLAVFTAMTALLLMGSFLWQLHQVHKARHELLDLPYRRIEP